MVAVRHSARAWELFEVADTSKFEQNLEGLVSLGSGQTAFSLSDENR